MFKGRKLGNQFPKNWPLTLPLTPPKSLKLALGPPPPSSVSPPCPPHRDYRVDDLPRDPSLHCTYVRLAGRGGAAPELAKDPLSLSLYPLSTLSSCTETTPPVRSRPRHRIGGAALGKRLQVAYHGVPGVTNGHFLQQSTISTFHTLHRHSCYLHKGEAPIPTPASNSFRSPTFVSRSSRLYSTEALAHSSSEPRPALTGAQQRHAALDKLGKQSLSNLVSSKPAMYTASSAFFEAMWEAGVSHCFVNLGSDHPSIIEAMVKGQNNGKFPKIITCPNEVRSPARGQRLRSGSGSHP